MTASDLSHDEVSQGRPIAAIPLAHLLLLPRSLLILSSSLYASHLHGIAAKSADVVLSSPASSPDAEGVFIANIDLLGDPVIIDSLRDTGRWRGERGTRTSLTFRHAEKVMKGGAFTKAAAGLRRG